MNRYNPIIRKFPSVIVNIIWQIKHSVLIKTGSARGMFFYNWGPNWSESIQFNKQYWGHLSKVMKQTKLIGFNLTSVFTLEPKGET